MIKRLTKRQIVDETVEYYKADPLRLAKGPPPGVEIGGSFVGCNYITDDGRKCAVGRCMIDPQEWPSTVTEQWKTPEELDKELEERYRGHSLAFWKSVQALHDFANWESEKSIQQYVDEIDCKMSKAEIVEETIQYYLEDPARRAFTLDPKGRIMCWYYMDNGRKCAVGRCMIDSSPFATYRFTPLQITELESLLKPDYRGHPAEFWVQLQQLHDNADWSQGEETIRLVARSLGLITDG